MKFIATAEYDSLLATKNQLEAILKLVGNPENKSNEEVGALVIENLEKVTVIEANTARISELESIEAAYNQLQSDANATAELLGERDASISDLTTQLNVANTEIERLGKQPGVMQTAVENTTDLTHDEPIEEGPKMYQGNLNENSPLLAKNE